jgi:transposase
LFDHAAEHRSGSIAPIAALAVDEFPSESGHSALYRRAKTDRLHTELLKRAFIGWLRGEPNYCHMAAIPTLEEEDARRPNRERENLVGERTRIINRIKSCLVRFGTPLDRTLNTTDRNQITKF